MGENLGDIVVVSLSTNISVPHKELRDRVKNNSILCSLVPDCMGVGAAFRQATTTATRGLSDAQIYEMSYEKSPEDSIVRTFYTAKFSKDGSAEKILTVALDKESHSLYCTIEDGIGRELGEEISDKIHKEFDRLYTDVLTIREIREYIRRVLLFCNCVKLRRNGGIYFVPLSLCPEVNNLIRSLEGVSGVDFTLISISNTEKNRKAIAKLFMNSISEYLKEEIGRLAHTSNTDSLPFMPFKEFDRALFATNMGVAVMNKMLNRFERAFLKVRIYTTLLGAEVGTSILSNMEDALEQLTETIEENSYF